MRPMLVKTLAPMAVVLAMGVCEPVMAQTDYPNKPLRLIVPMPPGGSNDIMARMIGKHLSDVVRQPVVVDNRPGAGGEIGITLAAHAAPDGYTFMLGSLGGLAHNPALKPNLQYDPTRDFAAVTPLATSAFVVVVTPSLPATNIKELVSLAKAKPGVLNYATAGTGSSMHLTAEYFKYATGTDMMHVAYKGGSQALFELIAGQTQLCFITLSAALGHIKSGKLRAIAVTSAKRAAVLPDVPTVAESGVEGFVVENWQGIVLPRKTPSAIVQKLNRDLITAVKLPGMAEALTANGLEALTSSPEEFGEFIKSEVARYKQVVKAANIKID